MAPPIVDPSLEELESMVIKTCPLTDQSWYRFLEEKTEAAPPTATKVPKGKSFVSATAKAKQQIYAEECRQLTDRMTLESGPYPHLRNGIRRMHLSTESTRDGAKVDIIRYKRECDSGPPDVVIVFYHGGGLWIGEADSEELSCRQMLTGNYEVYSVGYRLLPDYAASVCLQDAIDAFNHVLSLVSTAKPKIIIHGSSSGGELACFVSQHAVQMSLEEGTPIPFHGVMLRCPVTSDIWSGSEYIPDKVRHLQTTANPSFYSAIAGNMKRTVPRDGLDRMPVEVSPDILQHMPPTWLQLATNDVLYGDGLCYAGLLRMEGRKLGIDVVENYPHTFWLLAPQLPRAIEADRAMVDGLNWLVGLAGKDKSG